MSDGAGADFREVFPPTSGRVVGGLAVALCLLVLLVALLDGESGFGLAWVWGAAFFGILVYAALLRPGLRVEHDALVMRNMLETQVIPLAAIRDVVVRQVLVVRVGDRRYVSPAIGRSFLRTIRPRDVRQAELDYPEYVRERILHLADAARRRLGDGEAPAVRRIWAWPEIAGLVITAVATVVSNFV